MTRPFPNLSPGVLFAPAPEGGVVYDLVDEELAFVNPTAALLLDACERSLDPDPTLTGWADGAAVDPDRVRADVETALEDFTTRGLLARDIPPPRTHPNDTPVGPLADTETATTQAVGVHRLRFRSRTASLVDTVADLIGLACDDEPTAEHHIIAETDGSVRLITDTEWHFPDADAMAETLIVVINDFVARTATDAVLHAASVRTPRGATIVLPADPGWGKSTLAGLLIRQGWDYLGDESATIRTSDLAVVPCAKPLDLDPASCAVLGLAATDAGDVPVSAIAPDARVVTTPTGPPEAIIVPRYVGPRGTPVCEELDFTTAVTTLVGNTLNLRYVGTPGLQTLVSLAATVPVHRIAYRSGTEALDQIRSLGFG